MGIRLDADDLAWLSQEVRRLLDAQGLTKVKIFASNDLDEQIIADLKQQGATIAVWGVGTKLATGGSQAALGGVYKLGSIREPGKPWRRTVKVSKQRWKTSILGYLQVRRYRGRDGYLLADAIYDEKLGIPDTCTLVAPMDADRRFTIPAPLVGEDLLIPVCRNGHVMGETPELSAIRQCTMSQLDMLHPTSRRQLANDFLTIKPIDGLLWECLQRLQTRSRHRTSRIPCMIRCLSGRQNCSMTGL